MPDFGEGRQHRKTQENSKSEEDNSVKANPQCMHDVLSGLLLFLLIAGLPCRELTFASR